MKTRRVTVTTTQEITIIKQIPAPVWFRVMVWMLVWAIVLIPFILIARSQ